MQALILDEDFDRQMRLSASFFEMGITCFVTSSPQLAESMIRRSVVDLFIAPERVGGKLTHALVLLAEYRNPLASAILLSDRVDPEVEELFLLLPALHYLIGTDCSPDLIRKMAIASMAGVTDNRRSLMLAPSMRVEETQPAATAFSSRRMTSHEPLADACPAA